MVPVPLYIRTRDILPARNEGDSPPMASRLISPSCSAAPRHPDEFICPIRHNHFNSLICWDSRRIKVVPECPRLVPYRRSRRKSYIRYLGVAFLKGVWRIGTASSYDGMHTDSPTTQAKSIASLEHTLITARHEGTRLAADVQFPLLPP